jgi:hypothetical protein
LTCKKPGDRKIALTCAIALKNTVDITHEALTSASVNMRGTAEKPSNESLPPEQAGQIKSILVNKLKKIPFMQGPV